MVEAGKYNVQALTKGLRVLSCFGSDQPKLRMSDVVSATGLPMPTVYRLVRTLVDEGYLEELDGGYFRPSLSVMQLGFNAISGLDVVQAADPRLRALATQTEETVNLAVREGASITYLIRIKNRDLVTADLRVGSKLPVHSSSMGKLLLAFSPLAERTALLKSLDLSTDQGPNVIKDRAVLEAELDAIRARGWSFQDQELAYGLRSIAAPIRDQSHDVIAAINLAVAAHRRSMDELKERFLEDLLACATAISISLGDNQTTPTLEMP